MAPPVHTRQPLKLSHRVKTGDFAEEFTREANKLRNLQRSENSSSHKTGRAKRTKWLQFPWPRRPIEDEETPRKEPLNRHVQDDVHSFGSCRRISVSCTRVPHGVNKAMFILGVEDPWNGLVFEKVALRRDQIESSVALICQCRNVSL